jgi:hypothetical protein
MNPGLVLYTHSRYLLWMGDKRLLTIQVLLQRLAEVRDPRVRGQQASLTDLYGAIRHRMANCSSA